MTVKFHMTSSHNVTFRVTEDTSYSEEEWQELTEKEQEDAITEFIFNNIDVWWDM